MIVVIILFVILCALLKKPQEPQINEMLNKIAQLEKRLDKNTIVLYHEKQEHTDNTDELLKKITQLEKRLDANNIIEFDETQELLSNIQELEKRLDAYLYQ
jgi:predicted MPP superfamily phosphohydrolase